MRRRPLSITLIGWLFVAVGCFQLVRHSWPPIRGLDPGGLDGLVWIVATQVLSIVCGVLMLRGSNWGRWLLAVWLVEHLLIGLGHSAFKMIVHAVLFTVVAYLVFRPSASAYLRAAPTPSGSPRPGPPHLP